VKRRVRVVEHPVEGKRVVLIGVVPGVERVVVDQKSCTKFTVDIERTNNRLNHIDGLRGTLALDCALPEGHVTAEVKMQECTFDNRAKSL